VIWLHKESPWLGRGFVLAVKEGYADEFSRELAGRGFDVTMMRCGAGDDLHAEIAHAFRFPDYYGMNWDAFNECIAETVLPSRYALMWRDAGGFAAANPKLHAEASFKLLGAFDRLPETQAILVITGQGATFHGPTSA
jgi:RNAse (barnase) inhibitor barstar